MVKIPEIHIAIGDTRHALDVTLDKLVHAKDQEVLDEAFKAAKLQLAALHSLKDRCLEDLPG